MTLWHFSPGPPYEDRCWAARRPGTTNQPPPAGGGRHEARCHCKCENQNFSIHLYGIFANKDFICLSVIRQILKIVYLSICDKRTDKGTRTTDEDIERSPKWIAFDTSIKCAPSKAGAKTVPLALLLPQGRGEGGGGVGRGGVEGRGGGGDGGRRRTTPVFMMFLRYPLRLARLR